MIESPKTQEAIISGTKDLIARKIIYAGRVQGVGFRAVTARIAAQLQLAGYVKNLQTGQVEIFVQGEKVGIDSLITLLAQKMKNNILRVDIEASLPRDDLRGFDVRYDD